MNPKKLTHERASLICAQCHSTWLHNGPDSMRRWNENGLTYRPGGDPFGGTVWLLQPSRKATDARVAKMLANERPYVDGLFWSDGMMRVSGREFNGMIDSACYARGELSCLSCHAMHQPPGDPRPADVWSADQLRVGMDGDRACLQCHGEYAGKLAAHTQHAPDSPGSRCYNCHMPYTSYGLLKALRSHRIDVPSANATVAAGRPNACNLCHLDKSLGWTADVAEEALRDRVSGARRRPGERRARAAARLDRRRRPAGADRVGARLGPGEGGLEPRVHACPARRLDGRPV